MKRRRTNTTLCIATVAGSLAGCDLRGPDAITAAPIVTETPTETTKAEGDAAKESRTEAADIEATAGTSDTPEVIPVVAEVNPLDTIAGQTDTKSKEAVEELSGSKIKIGLQASGVLGSENGVLDAMLGSGGTINISCISAFALANYGAEKPVFLSIPYTFANHDHFWKFIDNELVPEFLVEPHDNEPGVRGLYYGKEGFRRFFTAKEAKGSDGLKSIKLRVSNNPIMNDMVEGLGTNPTVVSFNELYSALRTGVVDGAKQPIVNYKSNVFQEVALNLILDGHTSGAIRVIITDEVWDKLTEEQQNIPIEAGKVASQFSRTISEEVENRALEELKTNGINVVEIPDIKPWQDACKGIIGSFTKDQAELRQQILDMNE